MAERLRKAAAWLGLVTDDRYNEYGHADDELTEGVDLDEYVDDDLADRHRGEEASVTEIGHHRRTSRAVERSGVERAGGYEPSVAATATATVPTAATSREADLSRIITVHPRTYNEARAIGEHFRDGVPVIMNLSDMDDPDAKRLVDFAAGLIFGLRGSIDRVTSRVFLLSPPNVNVTAEDKERIAGEFFNQS
ncbi:cell division protein SepF [Propionibacteriaceae bacterium Y2011]|uniref:cell division protein SepF n=1 Tax=Microlunatus sp. Y2014 TaxID=3418488 RepID=UPI003B4D7325